MVRHDCGQLGVLAQTGTGCFGASFMPILIPVCLCRTKTCRGIWHEMVSYEDR